MPSRQPRKIGSRRCVMHVTFMVGRGVGHVGDVAGELAERPLVLVGRGIVADEALDDDLGRGRHFEIDRLAAHQLGRLAAVGAHHVPLAHAGRNRRAGQERHDRIPADHARHRHGLACGRRT